MNQTNSNTLLETKKDITKHNLNGRKNSQLIDTLCYNDGTFDTSATLNMMDWLLQWFKAPTDLIIKSFAFYCIQNDGHYWIENNIVKVQWNQDSLLAATDLQRRRRRGIEQWF